MLKKILTATIALSLYLSANDVSNQNIDCEVEFENCILVCNNTSSTEGDPMCVEKCEMLYDKCILLLESQNNSENENDIVPSDDNNTIEINDSNEEYIQSEIKSNSELEDNLEKIEVELNKKHQDN